MTASRSTSEHRTLARRSILAAPLLAGLAGTLGSAGVRPAAADTGTPRRRQRPRPWLRLRLPEPSGPHPVGASRLCLVDSRRADPWHDTDARRALMVTVFYPADPAHRHGTGRRPPLAYMMPGEAAAFDDTANNLLGLGLPAGTIDWERVHTHVRQDVPAARGRRPVLVYSPGLGEPRTFATAQAADLASRGYVVVCVDHTYESPAVEFPDGTVATMLPPAPDPRTWVHKVMAVRVADVRFVLDELARPEALPHGPAGTLDLTRVGMYGKSAGGLAALLAMAADQRIRAGANFDGNLGLNPMDPAGDLPPAVTDGIDRPFLLLGSDTPHNDTGPSWQAFLANDRGWKRRLTLLGSRHHSYADAQTLVAQAAGPLDLPDGTVVEDIGTITPRRSVQVQRAYVAAYFDRWLRGRPTTLFDRPSPRWPEMSFANPDGS
ncbi:alpha/beta hydrolase family protein [Actinopolymorpha singaporensis]